MPEPSLRNLPSVHALIQHPDLKPLESLRGREALVASARAVIDAARRRMVEGQEIDLSVVALAERARREWFTARPALRPVINATGILLHTGLGRAPLAAEAVDAVARVARGYCSLEFDLETGQRGRRTSGVSELLTEITGAEAAAVVNNNAAATILALRAVASGREVIVSRGELVEIGGQFRLPEIFEVSGARLREVGTTNRTRVDDYRKAIGPDTAAILRVHPSNYRIVGFTESATMSELAALAHDHGLIAIDDIGSGALDSQSPPGIRGEPTVSEGLRAGADLILFSGDKLLGGPQCGVIVGKKACVSRLETDPLMRAFRLDKMTLAALEATLLLAADPHHAVSRIPLWKYLTVTTSDLFDRATHLATRLKANAGLNALAIKTLAYVGGGSVPSESIESAGVRIDGHQDSRPWCVDRLARALRVGDPSVVPRIESGSLILDLRAVDPGQDVAIEQAVIAAIAPDLKSV